VPIGANGRAREAPRLRGVLGAAAFPNDVS
jgi:hypothetical protein